MVCSMILFDLIIIFLNNKILLITQSLNKTIKYLQDNNNIAKDVVYRRNTQKK